jgi:uncharacterized protein YndB with AHSA1/START domain
MAQLIYEQTVYILAPVSKVWDALIDPEMTKKYMFGCAVQSTWEPGSPVVWIGANGVEYVKGNLISFEPCKLLAFTVFDPNAGYIDDPANYLTTTYKLSEENGITKMDVSQGDYNSVENGEKRYRESFTGWEMTLNAFKNLVEG